MTTNTNTKKATGAKATPGNKSPRSLSRPNAGGDRGRLHAPHTAPAKAPAKPGYKHTPLGWIPEDWTIRELGDLSVIKGEYGINAPAVEYSTELPTYIRITDIDDEGNFIVKERKSVNAEGATKFLLADEDILFARTGATVGKTYIHNSKLNGSLVFAGFLIRFRTNSDYLIPTYLKAFTTTKPYWDWVKTVSTRSGQPGINSNEYCSLKIPLPPLPEQTAIANLLSTWDRAITATGALLAQKEQRKKWLMQQLLTGKKRLKGFGGEWKEVRLGDVFDFVKSYPFSRDKLTYEEMDTTVYCIHYGDIHACFENEFLDFSSQRNIPKLLSGDSEINPAYSLQDGDIIMADASEDYDGVGEAVEVVNLQGENAVGGLHTIVLRDITGITSERFRAYLFAGERVRNILRKKATGTSVYSVAKATLQSLTLQLPEQNEQTAIARVLQAADVELSLLRKKLEQLKEQKKGLMQQLLTGKKRLK